jgi:hypothetical protein
VSLAGADVAGHVPHAVHGSDRTYIETNCYTDVLVELLHARGDEPLAAMGIVMRLDFEGDQWTFFKPASGDIERLYGIDIHEMQPARDLPAQIAALLAAGRTATVELDSWFLPDTAATSYRTEHVKTTIVPEAIDRDAELLRYFHNAGYYELRGEDYRGVFRLDGPADPAILPPYPELVRFDAGPALNGAQLLSATRDLLARHLALRPAGNPFARFADALERDLPVLLAGEAADYHAYAFATVRMVGSGFELLAAHTRWLFGGDGPAAAVDAAAAMDEIVAGSKLLSLKLARRRAFDPVPVVDGLAAAWVRAVGGLDAALA